MRIPLLNRVSESLIAKIQMAITGERQAIVTYEKLMTMAPNEEHRIAIQRIIGDERKHLADFTKLFVDLTGQKPVMEDVEPEPFNTYLEGLKVSFRDEIEAAEFYRDVVVSTRLKRVQKVFFEAMVDEQEHAATFNFLFTDLVRMRRVDPDDLVEDRRLATPARHFRPKRDSGPKDRLYAVAGLRRV